MTLPRPHPVSCPICGAADILTGLSADNVPAHAVRLMATKNDATAEPRGQIALGFCRCCAFVFNTTFEPGLLSYDSDYESTQTHSAIYRSYIKEITADVLRHVTGAGAIVDVGCGQGEFLASFAAQTTRPLIGIDPAIDPTRLQVSGADMRPVEFRARQVTDPVALILCKMTLEHVPDPVDLLREMAALARKSPDTLVFVQVPNSQHMFSQTLFADLIYEHVNYFTQTSLVAACAQAGLDVVDCQISYEGQHLGVLARPCKPVAARRQTSADEACFTGFLDRVSGKISAAQQTVRALLAQGRPPVLWGSGSKAVAFLCLTGLEQDIALVVDINPMKTGTYLPGSGLEIISPNDPRLAGVSDIFIMNPRYRDEICSTLQNLGHDAALHLVE